MKTLLGAMQTKNSLKYNIRTKQTKITPFPNFRAAYIHYSNKGIIF